MKMTGMLRRRKAWIISAVIHFIMVVSIGFCLEKNTQPSEPVLIEVALTDSVQGQKTGGGGSSPPKQSGKRAVKTKQNQVSHAPSTAAVQQESALSETFDNSEYEEAEAGDALDGGDQAGEGTGSGGAGDGNSSGSGDGSGSGGNSGDGDGGGISPPAVLSNPEPKYPQAARKNGVEGTTYLRIQVLENGAVGDAGVVQTSGDATLDQAAVNAALRWRFVPAKNLRTGQAIACYTRVPIVFHLK